MPKVFIVILNWNKPGLTIDCLNSVKKLKTTGYELKVVVVDNGSIDDSVEKLKRVKGIKLIENNQNLGFAQGNNEGMKYALDNGADWVVVLNNDTLVDEDLIVEFLKASKNQQKVVILNPKIYFAKGFEFHKKRYKKSESGKVIWSAGGKIDWNNVYGSNRGVDEVDKGQYDKVTEIDFAVGTCLFCSSEALKEVGLFDERYFAYFEDTDLSMRMKKGGWKVLYAPQAVVWHKVAQSSAIGSGLNDYYTTRNRMIFGLRYAPVRSKLALLRESLRLLFTGREWQRVGIRDYYLCQLGKGSWQ